MNTPLAVERRQIQNSGNSVYRVETRDGTRTFQLPDRRELRADTTIETRDNDEGSPVIRGHAAVFDSRSEDLGGFFENVARGAFRKALDRGGEVKALFNHDPNIVLGNTRNNTLDMREDPKGLHYYATPPKTQAAEDVRELIRSGYVTQSSFAFTVERDRWEENEDGEVIRTILEVRDLFDVSPVTYPAYLSADTSARELETVVPAEGEEERMASVEPDGEDDREAHKARLSELQSGAKRRLALAKAR